MSLDLGHFNMAGVNGTNSCEFEREELRPLCKAFPKIDRTVLVRDVVPADELLPLLDLPPSVMKHYTAAIRDRSAIDFFTSNDPTRLVSLPDRNTARHGRPSPLAGAAPPLVPVEWAKWWREVGVTKLTDLTHAKYPAFPAEWEPLNREYQTLYMAVYDFVFEWVLTAAAHIADVELEPLLRRLGEETRARSTACVELVKRKAAFLDAVLLSEVNQEQMTAMRQWEDFTLICKPDPVSQQRAAVLVRKSKFEPIDSVADVLTFESADAAVGVYVTLKGADTRLLLLAAHATSNGSNAAALLAAAQSASCGAIVGIDSNCTWEKLPDLKLGLRGDLTLSPPTETTFRRRTPFVAQKHGMPTDPPVAEPKDLFAWKGFTLVDDSFRVDNTGMGVWRERPFPDAAFPSDHAFLTASFVPQ